jgi:hypothetical protein
VVKLVAKKVYKSGIGIFGCGKDRITWASMGGKVGGVVQAEHGLGFHKYKTDPELHKSWASKVVKLLVSFRKGFQSEMGKRGGIKNKGFVWINDGIKSFKYTAKQQATMNLDIDYLTQNPNIKRGRLNPT